MARYVVTGKVLPENLQFGVDYKCRKIRKSSGKLGRVKLEVRHKPPN